MCCTLYRQDHESETEQGSTTSRRSTASGASNCHPARNRSTPNDPPAKPKSGKPRPNERTGAGSSNTNDFADPQQVSTGATAHIVKSGAGSTSDEDRRSDAAPAPLYPVIEVDSEGDMASPPAGGDRRVEMVQVVHPQTTHPAGNAPAGYSRCNESYVSGLSSHLGSSSPISQPKDDARRTADHAPALSATEASLELDPFRMTGKL